MSNQRLERREAEAQLDRMLTDYHKSLPFLDYRIPFANKDPLRDAVESSPELKARLVESIQNGYVTKFTNGDPGEGAGAEHKPTTHEIVIPEKLLSNKPELVFALGHENAHALSMKGISLKDTAKRDIDVIVKSQGLHDYTAPVKALVEGTMAEEAQAHLGGFNASVSALRKAGIEPTEKNLYLNNPGRMKDFIEVRGAHPDCDYALKAGLTRDQQTGFLPKNAENVTAMHAYYPDKMPGTFGENGMLNYRHQAVLDGLQMAHTGEKTALGDAFKEKLAEWDRNWDVSQPTQPDFDKLMDDNHLRSATYRIDFDQMGVNRALLDVKQFKDGQIPVANPVVAPDDFPKVVTSREMANSRLHVDAEARERAPSLPQGADAMQHHLYKQAIEGVSRAKLDGVGSREEMLNVAASLALEAHKNGIASIDHVVKGEKGNVFAIQGSDAGAIGALRANVDVASAKTQPSQDNLGQLHAGLLQTQQAQTTGLAQQPVRHTQ